MNILIRLILTALIVSWAVFPFIENPQNESVLGEIASVGLLSFIIIIAVFFMLIALYCRTLYTCLKLITPQNRKASPTSVWYMFLMPFNFIEDFFIVINLSHSIEAERKTNLKLQTVKDHGLVSGMGWCIAQIMAFIPNVIGQVSGTVSVILVIYHWVQIARINRLLKG